MGDHCIIHERLFSETQIQKGEVRTMCFRPSNVDGNIDGPVCQTCGMPVSPDMSNCPYCGDPIALDQPAEPSDIDPSYSTRIL